MVTAIIAESTLDCTVGTKQLLLATPYKAAAPNMGALRMELKRSRNGNEGRIQSTCFQIFWLLFLVRKV